MLDDAIFADQRDLQAVLQSLLSRRLPPLADRASGGQRAAAASAIAGSLEEIGVSRIGIPEAFGGDGGGLLELAVVARELGRALAPASVLLSGVVGQLAETVDPAAATAIVDALMTKPTALVVDSGWYAGAAGAGGERLRVLHIESREVVSGVCTGVLDFDAAGQLLVLPSAGAAGIDPVEIWMVGCEASASTLVATTDAATVRTVSTVRLEDAPVTRIAVPQRGVVKAVAVARLLLAYEMLGAAEGALRIAADHVSVREQFGRPIGTFQAVQHRLAAAFTRLQVVGGAASLALRNVPGEYAQLASESARLAAATELLATTQEALQVVGAVGYTWEFPLHHFVKYANIVGRTLGEERGVKALARAGGAA